MKHVWLMLALCALPALSSAAPQDSEPPPQVLEEARRHFLDGSKAYNLGEFARAVEEYKAAYNSLPDPSFLYNIAQAYRLSGDLSQALFFYRSYLRNLTGSANRREVEVHIQHIEAQLQRQNAIVTAPPTGAAPPTRVSPPPPEPTVTSPPSNVAPPAQASAELTAPPPQREPTPTYKKGWVWGVVVASVVVAAGLGVGLGVGLTRGNTNAPSTDVGTNKVFSATHSPISFGVSR